MEDDCKEVSEYLFDKGRMEMEIRVKQQLYLYSEQMFKLLKEFIPQEAEPKSLDDLVTLIDKAQYLVEKIEEPFVGEL